MVVQKNADRLVLEIVEMARAEDRTKLIAEILAMEWGLAPLNRSTLPQLRALLDSMKEQAAAYAAAGLTDVSA